MINARRIMQSQKWLVLLDVDGTLCARRTKGTKSPLPTTPPSYSGGKGLKAWDRPFVREFVRDLLDKGFYVGTWTSSTEPKAKPLLKHLLGPSLFKSLSIVVCSFCMIHCYFFILFLLFRLIEILVLEIKKVINLGIL